jgi:hypothetical protein
MNRQQLMELLLRPELRQRRMGLHMNRRQLMELLLRLELRQQRMELHMNRRQLTELLLRLELKQQRERPLLLELHRVLENRDEPSDRKFNLESNNF